MEKNRKINKQGDVYLAAENMKIISAKNAALIRVDRYTNLKRHVIPDN